jgi:hypothetical protein
LPSIRGEPWRQAEHAYLYWEFYEQGSRQAVRLANWKGVIQPMGSEHVELYDLNHDLGEKTDVAAAHRDVVQKILAVAREAHTPSTLWHAPAKP